MGTLILVAAVAPNGTIHAAPDFGSTRCGRYQTDLHWTTATFQESVAKYRPLCCKTCLRWWDTPRGVSDGHR
uniref:Uncharacterized protein n=1 Tax=viral metagenome TaxID=1070528 RepID=A0A6M3LMD5_9ZZZZ